MTPALLGTFTTSREAGWALSRCTPDVGAFLQQTWGRRAEVFVGVDALGYADLLTFDDVDRLLTTTSLRTPSFRLVRSDRAIAESEYTRSATTGSRPVSGLAEPARIFELFRDGATIVLQGLHRYWQPVSELNRALELELGHPCQVNAYVTPPGARGLARHEDPHEVFVLQAFGSKDWEVHAAPGESAREPFRPKLRPGDSIYMPRGTPHAASTQQTLSGHLTIGIHVVSWRDVLAEAWNAAALDPSLDEPVPVGWTRDPEGFARMAAERVGALGSSLERVDLHELAGARIERFLSTRLPLLRGGLVDGTLLDRLDDETELLRRPGSVCEPRVRDGHLIVLLGDRRLEMPTWLEPAMRRIEAARSIRAADLRAEIPDEGSRLVLVRRLVREGLLRPPPAP